MKKVFGFIVIMIVVISVAYFLKANFFILSTEPVKVISLEDLKKKIEQKEDFILVDVRSELEYKSGHLPNALNLPFNKINKKTASSLPKDEEIIVYCSNTNCSLSERAAQKLKNLGFKNVLNFKEGVYGYDKTLLGVSCNEPGALPCEESVFFDKSILSAIIAASLVSSLNPCSIALILFLFGYLIIFLNQRKKALKLGAFYIGSVFVVSFLLGILLYKGFNLFFTSSKYLIVSDIINFILGGILLIFGIINIKDFFWPGALGISVEVPAQVKLFFNKLIEKAAYLPILFLAILVVPFGSPCSLPLYLGVVKIISSFSLANVLLYLGIYNLIYILPLVLILLFVWFGGNLNILKEKEERGKKWLKLIIGIILIIVGIILI